MDNHVFCRGVSCGKRDPSADSGEASEVSSSGLGGMAPWWLGHHGQSARCTAGRGWQGLCPRVLAPRPAFDAISFYRLGRP